VDRFRVSGVREHGHPHQAPAAGWHFLPARAIFTNLQAEVFTRAVVPGKGFPLPLQEIPFAFNGIGFGTPHARMSAPGLAE